MTIELLTSMWLGSRKLEIVELFDPQETVHTTLRQFRVLRPDQIETASPASTLGVLRIFVLEVREVAKRNATRNTERFVIPCAQAISMQITR